MSRLPWVLTFTVLVMFASAASAFAQTSGSSGPRPVVVGVALSTDGGPTGVRLNVANTFPGDRRSVGIFLDGEYVYAVDRISLTVDNLRDLENDCLRQEALAGDNCSDPVGELSQFLWLSAEPGTETTTVVDGEPRRSCVANAAGVGSGTAPHRLDEIARDDDLPLVMERPPGDLTVMCGIVRLWFEPRSDANIAMTDSSIFDLHTVFEWDPEVLPAEFWLPDPPPGGPGGPGGPGTPPGPGGPGGPTDPADPTDPEAPTDPDGPVDPTDPVGPTDPTRPTPSDPDGVEPGTPPGTPPGSGGQPSAPGAPDGGGSGGRPPLPGDAPELIVDERADDEGAAGGRGPRGPLAFTGGTLQLLFVLGVLSVVAGGLTLYSRRPAAARAVGR
jgi:hypothetical protein